MYGGVAGEDGRLSPLCRSSPHKIRDPELLKNPEPNHAEFETFLLVSSVASYPSGAVLYHGPKFSARRCLCGSKPYRYA